MSMRFQEQNGKATVFVDPNQPLSRLVHSFVTNRKSVGPSRIPNVNMTINQSHFYKYDPCDTGACDAALTDARGSVNLNGTNPEEVKLAWEALKVNVDEIIKQGGLVGLRPVLGTATFVSAESIRPETPAA